MGRSWIPLENNPEVLNRYMEKIGAGTAKTEFVDVYGVSEELLAMVPLPVYAVLFVYPITSETEASAKATTTAQMEEVGNFMRDVPLFYTKQYTENACGTIALIHAMLNNADKVGPFEDGSVLAELQAAAKADGATPTSIGTLIRDHSNLETAHATASSEGATAEPDSDTPVNLHFVCFICAGGRCVELDGRQANPILHGACTSSAEFLSAAAAAMQARMQLIPNSFEFSITALADRCD